MPLFLKGVGSKVVPASSIHHWGNQATLPPRATTMGTRRGLLISRSLNSFPQKHISCVSESDGRFKFDSRGKGDDFFCGVRRAANSHLLDPFAPRWWNNLLKKLFTTPKRLTGERESIFRCIQPRTALNYIAWILYKVCWYYDSRLPGTYLQTIILLDLMNFNVTYFPHDGIVTHRY